MVHLFEGFTFVQNVALSAVSNESNYLRCIISTIDVVLRCFSALKIDRRRFTSESSKSYAPPFFHLFTARTLEIGRQHSSRNPAIASRMGTANDKNGDFYRP